MPEIFVNREGAKRRFATEVRNISEDRTRLLVFHGAGGQGKSALCYELTRLLDAKRYDAYNRIVLTARVSFEHEFDNRVDPLVFLIRIRNAFALQGLSIPGFDLAYAFVWEHLRPHERPPLLTNAWLTITRENLGEAICETVDTARETLQDEVNKVPFLGTVLRKLSSWTIDAAKREWLFKSRGYLPRFFRDGNPKDDHELLNALLRIFSSELSREKDEDARLRFVLLLDEYESLFPGGISESRYIDQPIDRTLRRFLENASNLLVVLFSREPPAWPQAPYLTLDENCLYNVSGLEKQYAVQWLCDAGISEHDIRHSILSSCKVDNDSIESYYPLLLSLSIDHYRNLVDQGRELCGEDFQLTSGSLDYRLTDVLRKILKDYSADRGFRLIFEALSVADQFDRETIVFVCDFISAQVPGDMYTFLQKQSFIDEGEHGFLSIHKKIAEISRQLMKPDYRSRIEDALINHFIERAINENKNVV